MSPTFDELYVVSDLHLGGRLGFQIFDQGDVLADFIEWLAVESSEKSLGLVLNGDVVDFLAEEPAAYLDPTGAVGKLRRIFGDSAFARIPKALAKFVGTERRTLIV